MRNGNPCENTTMERLMRRTSLLSLAVLLGLAPPAARAQQADLLLVVGADTIARERFTRRGGELEADLLSPALNARMRFSVTAGPDGRPARMHNAFWLPTDADSAPARQVAEVSLTGDSVFVEIPGRGTQRFRSARGAIPYLNPSFALIELVLHHAPRGAGAHPVPAFMVQGGQTLAINVTWQGPDSALVEIGGAMARLRVDGESRILGGIVPAQNLRILRSTPAAGAGAMTAVRPDYSAPAGAPYRAIAVRIPTPGGHVLAGTLTLPEGAGPGRRVPAVVTSTGSGLQDRDEHLPLVPGYRPFRQLADTLSRHGIAVLRMDDRGHGESGGDGSTATTRDFADDVRAGLAWLRRHEAIDARRLGVVGHSEGGLVAPLVAATDTTLRAIVLLASPSRRGRQVITYQQRAAIDGAPGLTASQRDSLFRVSQAALDSAEMLGPWLREYLEYDPIPTARRVRRTPVLIVHGATDRQVTADQAPELDAAFRAGGNPDVTLQVYPEANHLLAQDPSGDPAGYPSLPQRAVRADILAAILAWLGDRLR